MFIINPILFTVHPLLQRVHSILQAFSWGTYDVARVAYDAAGNSASCYFKVYVLEEFCPKLEDPVGGVQHCTDWGPGGRFKVCKIECNEGLKFSTEVREVPSSRLLN